MKTIQMCVTQYFKGLNYPLSRHLKDFFNIFQKLPKTKVHRKRGNLINDAKAPFRTIPKALPEKSSHFPCKFNYDNRLEH